MGKTDPCPRQSPTSRKHPHGRGEDHQKRELNAKGQETPPRAWGRPPLKRYRTPRPGNTPTGVGKTHTAPCSRRTCRKHPHGRGEDLVSVARWPFKVETPPRAWGRLRVDAMVEKLCGNTPTGVGKTPANSQTQRRHKKHPHGRGEDCDHPDYPRGKLETPPRAWGRQGSGEAHPQSARNTPTGVGKTGRAPGCACQFWKHPHGRGEDNSNAANSCTV